MPRSESMKPEALTRAEYKWFRDLEKLMAACPSKRLGCYTVGDADLKFFDVNVRDAWLEVQRYQDTDIDEELRGSGATLNVVIGCPFQVESRTG